MGVYVDSEVYLTGPAVAAASNYRAHQCTLGGKVMILEGKVWRYGDNVDTDVIIPARYLNTADPKELAQHCMEDIDVQLLLKCSGRRSYGNDRNFGCGSSREHAPVAIKASGVTCVIAGSFARIFYRNAINIGLPLIELGDEGNRDQSRTYLLR